jgi:tRNA(fMet)-specific endonuclease VapC
VPLYILDTDSITFQQAGCETIIRHLQSVPADSVYTTVITVYEQIRGRLAAINRAREGRDLVWAYERLQATLRYFSLVNVLPFTSVAAQRLEKLRAEKVRIGTQDLRIAAIVLSVNGVLITSNRRDFDKVPGLIIEDWNT